MNLCPRFGQVLDAIKTKLMALEVNSIEQATTWMQTARGAVVLTGAGISTESGIPDFRSPGGVWSKYRTVYYDEFLTSSQARHEYWRQKCESHSDFATAHPNAGHVAIATWERENRIRGVITQNIDGLHQLAGNEHVLELHGTARQATCLDCGTRFDVIPFVEQFRRHNHVPPCPDCGGWLKHATISFGQSLPANVLEQATDWSQTAEVMLAVGSSLVVTPAANLPVIAKQCGAKLIIVNRDETPVDPLADLVIRGSIGEVLSAMAISLEN
jgi:NAD-dependent deacetylase